MTMRVTIITTLMGESGSLLTAGNTYTVSDAFGAALVGGKRATDTDGVLTPPQTESKPYLATDPLTGVVTGLVGPGGVIIPMLYSYQNAWVGFGDSIMNVNGGPNIGAGVNRYDKGWVTWASAALGGRLNCVRNAGVSGDTTAMMLARLETDVTPYASQARICIFNGGVNDPAGGSGVAATFAQTKANLTAIITR